MRTGKYFSLIEISIAIAVIAIVYVSVIPRPGDTVVHARETVLKNNLKVLRECIDRYYGDFGEYPEELQLLVEKKYLSALPLDPFTGSSDWELIYYEPPEGEPVPLEQRIYNVKSNASGTALDGTYYKDW